ncbi:MAG TPA: tetratricopeptide repeat protein [Deltaproteobacteria bacterium]|nr:tetratricopeptide repeat protein [Deltaproteobacteria bacterium]
MQHGRWLPVYTAAALLAGALCTAVVYFSLHSSLPAGEREATVSDGGLAGPSELRSASGRGGGDFRSLYRLGLVYYNREDFDGAIALWKRAAAMLPEGDMMKTTLMDIVRRAERRKALTGRMRELEKAVDLKAPPLAEGLELASLYIAERRFFSAGELYRAMTQVHADDPRPWAGLAKLVYRQGRILWAERYARRAIALGTIDEEVMRINDEIEKLIPLLAEEGYDELVKRSHPAG